MNKVFISYRRKDSRAYANMLKADLDDRMDDKLYHIFLDTSERDGFQAGALPASSLCIPR